MQAPKDRQRRECVTCSKGQRRKSILGSKARVEITVTDSKRLKKEKGSYSVKIYLEKEGSIRLKRQTKKKGVTGSKGQTKKEVTCKTKEEKYSYRVTNREKKERG